VPAKIVIGFDGADSGEDALALGMLLARATRAVPLVAVVHPDEYPIGVGRVDAEWVAYMHKQAEQLLGRARRLLGEEAGAEFREVSAPSESRGLHELAEQERAELVVVGSSHRGPLGRTYPGSTGDRLLQGSACPVAVAPRGLRESPPERLGTIAVAYLDTPEAGQALDAAVALAEHVGARLRLVSVMPRPAEVYLPVVGRDAEEAFVASTRELFQRALDAALGRALARGRRGPAGGRRGRHPGLPRPPRRRPPGLRLPRLRPPAAGPAGRRLLPPPAPLRPAAAGRPPQRRPRVLSPRPGERWGTRLVCVVYRGHQPRRRSSPCADAG
jgi:nucleotide-binding universal stress UspA family protein